MESDSKAQLIKSAGQAIPTSRDSDLEKKVMSKTERHLECKLLLLERILIKKNFCKMEKGNVPTPVHTTE